MNNNSFLGVVLICLMAISCNLFDKQDNGGADSNSASTPESTATPLRDDTDTSVIADTNYLSFASGAALLKFPIPDSMQFSSHNILDGGSAFWLSREGEATNQNSSSLCRERQLLKDSPLSMEVIITAKVQMQRTYWSRFRIHRLIPVSKRYWKHLCRMI